MISLSEYAAKHGKANTTVRQMAERGGFKTAQKIARNWIIDENEPYPDARIKSGKYVDWRKKERGEGAPRNFYLRRTRQCKAISI